MSTLSVTPQGHKFEIDRTGITFNEDLTFEEWSALGDELAAASESIGWIVGDWLNYGQRRYGEKYREAAAVTKMDPDTLKTYAYVARNVQTSTRINDVTFSHHRMVAKVKDPYEQRKFLEMARDEGLTVRRLQKSINFGRLATPEEMEPDPTDRGHVTYLALINRLRRWWKQELEKKPLKSWDKERRIVLMDDFKIVKEIYDDLQQSVFDE